MDDYRVHLDVYNGPMDLLLYLIRKEEVEVYDIPIARITEQYLEHLELIRALDVNLAGEFVVLAATLMEIKSRMLLPHPPPLEQEEGEDPRMELVRELLEYKKFRDAAEELKARAAEQQLKFPRLARAESERPQGAQRSETPPPTEGEPAVPLKEVELWDVFAAFRKLMKETMGRLPQTIVYDDIPVSEFMHRLVERMGGEASVRFWELFEGRRDRMHVVGTFLALLELIRRRVVVAFQEEPFGEILLQLRPGEEAPEPSADAQAPTEDQVREKATETGPAGTSESQEPVDPG